MKTTSESDFRGSQQNLYSIARLAWGYCLAVIEQFALKSIIYSPEYVAAMLAKVAAAEALPSYKANKGPSVSYKKKMTKDNRATTLSSRSLWFYITTGWPEDEQAAMLSAAGYDDFVKASDENWEKTASMVTSAKSFMVTYRDELETKGKMPKMYPDEFDAIAAVFTASKTEYIEVKQQVKTANKAKIDANNAVYKDLNEMLKWGKIIFLGNLTMFNKFVYDELMKLVRGNDPSGGNGFIRETNKKTPISDVLIKVIGQNVQAVTNEKGKFEFNIASGTYDIEISKPGYITVLIKNKEIEVGKMSRLSMVLERVPPPVDDTPDIVPPPAAVGQPAAK